MKIVKYSKKYGPLLKIKKDFYTNNSLFIKNSIKVNKFYSKQKKRKKCKNCNSKIAKNYIKNFYVSYSICKKCNHLNGEFEDTKKFTKWLYQKDGKFSQNYAINYLKDYNTRVKNIYIPKVEFLKKIIKEKITLLDMGAGGGHMLKALELKKINATGIESNITLTKLGQKKLKKNKLIKLDLDKSYHFIKDIKNFNVVSLIGVLEHLEKPNDFLVAFNESSAKYLYIVVPLYSLSTFLENSFKHVYPRHLSDGHTHLYTEKSLNYLAKKNNLNIIGEWWFGTDIADLYRSLSLSKDVLNKKIYQNELKKNLSNHIDTLQAVLDKQKNCSEVHMIFKKK
jgi:2-polyprenyl-3-methyl-5-hydroxy-6-metoxy-1,4-benzoquinol methylase